MLCGRTEIATFSAFWRYRDIASNIPDLNQRVITRDQLSIGRTCPRPRTALEAIMYIANDIRRPSSLGKVRRETLRRWVEELLATEHVGAASDDIRYAAAKKIQPPAERRGS